MNIKRIITENLGLTQWLLTWLILVGMVLAGVVFGYYLVPETIETFNKFPQLGIKSLRLAGIFGPLIFFTIFGSVLISRIWQVRFVKKES